jgi:hypothetical protein
MQDPNGTPVHLSFVPQTAISCLVRNARDPANGGHLQVSSVSLSVLGTHCYPGHDIRLTREEKDARKRLFQLIMDRWPQRPQEEERVVAHKYSLSSPSAFWAKMLRPSMNQWISELANAKNQQMVCWLLFKPYKNIMEKLSAQCCHGFGNKGG